MRPWLEGRSEEGPHCPPPALLLHLSGYPQWQCPMPHGDPPPRDNEAAGRPGASPSCGTAHPRQLGGRWWWRRSLGVPSAAYGVPSQGSGRGWWWGSSFCSPSVPFPQRGGSRGVRGHSVSSRPGLRAQPSLVALFFVSAAQQLAQPPAGRGTALGGLWGLGPGVS